MTSPPVDSGLTAITDEAVHKMCAYLSVYDRCSKCPRTTDTPYGPGELGCFGIALETLEKAREFTAQLAARGRECNNDNFNQEFFAQRAALRDWPAMPPAYVLKWLDGDFPKDYERGKEIQRELGLWVIPPVTECEIGAGMWDRITNGAWRASYVAPAQKEGGE